MTSCCSVCVPNWPHDQLRWRKQPSQIYITINQHYQHHGYFKIWTDSCQKSILGIVNFTFKCHLSYMKNCSLVNWSLIWFIDQDLVLITLLISVDNNKLIIVTLYHVLYIVDVRLIIFNIITCTSHRILHTALWIYIESRQSLSSLPTM